MKIAAGPQREAVAHNQNVGTGQPQFGVVLKARCTTAMSGGIIGPIAGSTATPIGPLPAPAAVNL